MSGPGLRLLVALNAAALLSAVGWGAVVSAFGRHHVRLAPAAAPVSLAANTRDIAARNGRVWLAVCGGVLSLGSVGAAVLVTNGFRFGMDASTVARSAPEELPFLLPHSGLEFAAFTLAAAACQRLGWQLFALLALGRRSTGTAPCLLVLIASACLGVAAAVAEAMAQAARLG